ncbi:PPK2 family polyphosphate kinase [Micromonospora andamanensis]|uniref:Polyphosphate kinase n=1 Tax=Micromonospora andamanensis TaxID=1287068 RepID=A0ABQ4HPB4_9ACTN|nr:PPK2 family polyphosphate kinase [Micromonospora andamanensis]GIJ07496.1 polyphosphate kinase [Micromonospora andamanensis]
MVDDCGFDVVAPTGGAVRDRLRVPPGGPVDLAAIDTRSTPGLPGIEVTGPDRKNWARRQVARLGAGLAGRQEMLFAGAKADPGVGRRVLLVLQAMDCGGKDGTVKRVVGAMNPLGVHIRAFGPPTAEELRHHFLWRIRRALPPPGHLGVFNRSHYEDVLVPRVQERAPEDVWRPRYAEIDEFERELTDAGVVVVKVFLHISKAEQARRLLARLDDPTKHWKYHPSDVDARARWDDYQAAYAEVLARCGTDLVPWYVVPADRKWYRDWAVAHLLNETFDTLDLGYPPADFDIERERERLLGTTGPVKVNGS